MKYLLPFLLLLSFNVLANSLSFDPNIPGNSTLTITCEYPIAREDGTKLDINEIATVKFFVEKNGVGGYLPAGENATACRQVYDMSQVPDGAYVYVVTAVDTDGRESQFSATNVTALVKRIAVTNAPANVTGTKS